MLGGGVHGIAQIVENLFETHISKRKRNIFRSIKVALIFVFVSVSWIFFRAQSISEAMYIFNNLFCGINNPITYFYTGFVNINMSIGQIITYVLLCILPLFIFDFIAVTKEENTIKLLEQRAIVFQWMIFIFIGLIIVFLSPKGVAAEFVYFQF